MNLSEFIAKLQEIESAEPENGKLPVCLSDWGECCQFSSEKEAEEIAVLTGRYKGYPYDVNGALSIHLKKSFIQIGS